MGQTLSTMTSGRFLAPADKATDSAVQRLWCVMRESGNFRHDAIPDRLALTEGERVMVSNRLAQVERHLTPARAAAIKRSVGMVKGLMASTAVDGQSAAEVLNGYAIVLAPYPQALVEDICTRFLDGRLGNRVYAPTPAEIAHECRNDADYIAARAERHRLQAVMDAEVYQTPSPEEQATIQAEYQRYVDETARISDPKGARSYAEPTGYGEAERRAAQEELKIRKAVVEAEIAAAEAAEAAAPAAP